MIYVQFSDKTQTVIVSVFHGPQDPDVYPNQGTVDGSDKRCVTFMAQFTAKNGVVT
ncbi:hypothetical protein GN109_06030 [Collimonas pratensis]|uniref:hypothetical protein n=1 Tax=Collimonas pratensis TaxID=279113 RepID=UPI00143CDADB|nr:hypothetical protein [Collimonas pratensis]NKI68972.1 hypothetical protein [Collimonas pratensis]